MKECVNCHKWFYYSTDSSWCGCEPVKVWIPSRGQKLKDAREFYSRDSEATAIEVAEDSYNDDPCNPHDFEMEVHIQGAQGGVEKFKISAEATVNFSADEIH